jgi:hypothetical protein
MPIIKDRYASAVRSSNLRSVPKTRMSDTDVLGAYAIADRRLSTGQDHFTKHPLAVPLERLFLGDDRAAGEVIRILADMIRKKAPSMRVKITQVQATDMARASLGWFRKPTRPGAARVKEATQRTATGQVYLGISKAINAATGGSDYEAGKVSWTPELYRYLAQTIGGGVLRELEKAINASSAASRGDDVKMSQIPVAGRFYGEVDDAQVKQSRYFETSKKIDSLDNTRKAIIKAGDTDALEKLYAQHPDAALIELGNKVQSNVSKLNKLAATTIDDPASMREIDAARVETMDLLNQAVTDLEQSKPATPAAKVKGWKREAVAQ